MIRWVERKDFKDWLLMRAMLWPECPKEGHEKEIIEQFQSIDSYPVFVAEVDKKIVGFVEGSVHEYSPGCHTKNIGYIEGWFVLEEYRNNGIGKQLIKAMEDWSLSKGFKEVGSDAENDNIVSILAHQKLGYQVIGNDLHEHKFLKEIDIPNLICLEKNPSLQYNERKGCYGLIIKNELLACVKTPRGYFLPGGGMEGLENFNETLKREIIEELGYTCEIKSFVCKINEFECIHGIDTEFIGYFYEVELMNPTSKIETDHQLEWIDVKEATFLLKPHYQRCAVQMLLNRK